MLLQPALPASTRPNREPGMHQCQPTRRRIDVEQCPDRRVRGARFTALHGFAALILCQTARSQLDVRPQEMVRDGCPVDVGAMTQDPLRRSLLVRVDQSSEIIGRQPALDLTRPARRLPLADVRRVEQPR